MTKSKEPSLREGLSRVAPKPEMLVPQPYFEYPLSFEETTEFITPSDRLFTIAHLGVPKIEIESWGFDISGLVEAPRSYRYEDLATFETYSIQAIHQCAGNPLDPANPTRTIANVEWRGVLLRDLLNQVGILPECKYIWAYGLDCGSFSIPPYSSPHQEHYVKDLPIEYIMDESVLVATHLNGEPLSPNHGYPARIVAPGYYGNNSVKWLCRIEGAARRADGLFTKELYNDPIGQGEETKPVWDIAPESLIVHPANEGTIPEGEAKVWGWAWSSVEVEKVQISADGGRTWDLAGLSPREHASWQRFEYIWNPTAAGRYEIMSRAEDVDGHSQPMTGARNEVHKVTVEVGSE